MMAGTQIEAVGLYVGLNLLLTLLLAILVVRQRLKTGVSFGSGGSNDMEHAIRAHGNNVEYIALVLPGLIMLALLGASTTLIHVAGIMVTVSRLGHAIGISKSITPLRRLGTLFTWVGIAIIGIGCLWYVLS